MNYEKNLNKQSGICPKCAEKDAEIAEKEREIEELKNDLAVKSHVNKMIIQSGSDIAKMYARRPSKERDELKAKLETARKALEWFVQEPSRPTLHEHARDVVFKEALKQIGE